MTVTRENLAEIIDQIYSDCVEIFRSRNTVYARKEDALSNFTKFAKIATNLGFSFHCKDLTPESVALWMAAFKLERWSTNLLNEEEPKDSRRDLINYTILGEACGGENVEQ